VSKAWCDAETDEKVAFIGGKGSGLGGVFLEEEAIKDRDQVHGSRGGGKNNSFDIGVSADRGAKDRVPGGYGGPVSSEEQGGGGRQPSLGGWLAWDRRGVR
jgi:hypothetical protein